MKTPIVELSVIVPTFNERDNIAELVRRLGLALFDVRWEVIFVDDDSPDKTADVIREIAQSDPRVRVIQRVGRRGLSSACTEGMLASAAPYVAVMDADLQHDEKLLPKMLTLLKNDDIDLVVGSRYVEGGGLGDWDETRAKISRFATRLSKLVVRAELSDPMSGFFMLRRNTLNETVRKLSAIGFKILVDFFASAPRPLLFKELPYEFRSRFAGTSKLDNQAAWDYLMLLLDKLIGHIIPVRFIAFSAVGSAGLFVHLLTVALLFQILGVGFVVSQSVATSVAIVSNFTLNNILTYRDMRLRGLHWIYGLASFAIACSFGAFANVGVAAYLFSADTGWALAAVAGVIVGAVWNYAITSVYTWKKPAMK
jgi:dolichol-phosphate mannosyltransferase